MTGLSLVWAVAAVAVAFGLSWLLVRRLAGLGSDQPVCIFLADVIRENGFRLFRRVPRLINPSYCGAYPLFLPWLLARIGTARIGVVERYLNPTMNALTVAALAVMLQREGAIALLAPACLLLALTPQLYHALSPRNFGISTRPLGLLLFLVLGCFVHLSRIDGGWMPYVAAVACAYLIWGCSTFALQTMLFTAVLRVLLFGDWTMAAVAFSSALAFFVLHPRYGLSYAWHSVRFSSAYAGKLAPLFILDRRHSIWRDVVYDFWQRLRTGPKQQALRYIYENAAVIGVLLNVTTPLALALYWLGPDEDRPAFVDFAIEMTMVGGLLFLVTSFRPTRFLGEPERYLELMAPFSVCAAAYLMLELLGPVSVPVVLVYFAAVDAGQLILARTVRQAMRSRTGDVLEIIARIEQAFASQEIRFTCNNDELLKHFLVQPWLFARYWSYAEPFAGYTLDRAFAPFPNLRTEVVEAAIETYDINVCLVDRSAADREPLFADAPDWQRRLETLWQTPDYLLLRIRDP